MAITPLSQAIYKGLDPGVYQPIQQIETGDALTQAGLDASPTSKWGALGRIAQAAAGSYLTNTSRSKLADTIAGGKKQALDDLMAALERPAAVPGALPQSAAPRSMAQMPTGQPQPAVQPAAPQASPQAYDPAAFAEAARKQADRVDEPAVPFGTPPATTPAVAVAAPTPASSSPAGPDYGSAISKIESGGKYDLLGPVTKSGDRAYGKYQVMGANIPEWTKAHLGQAMTPEQFLASPEAQDAVFKGKFGEYAQKYGPEGAAKAWFAGEHGMNNPNAKDQLGTSVQSYADQFMSHLGSQPGPQAIEEAAAGKPVQVAQATPQTATDAAPESGLDVHKLLAVMQNPYADETTKAIAGKLLLKKLTPDEDEFASSPQGIYNKRTGELKQGSTQSAFGNLQGPELMDAVKQANPALASQAQAVLEGRVPYPTGSRLHPQQQQLKELVTQIDPNFTSANSKVMQDTLQDYGTKGRTGQARVAANTMLGHADTLDKLVDKLGNYTYLPSIMNPVHNAVAGETDPEYQKVRGDFETTKKALATEAEKALAGHTTLAGIKEQMDNLDRAKSPEELHSAIHGLVHVLGSRLESMASGFDTSMHTRTQGHEFLDPKGREIFNRFEGINAPASADVGRIPQMEGGTPAAAPATAAKSEAAPSKISTKEEYDKLPSGKTYIDPNGVSRTKK